MKIVFWKSQDKTCPVTVKNEDNPNFIFENSPLLQKQKECTLHILLPHAFGSRHLAHFSILRVKYEMVATNTNKNIIVKLCLTPKNISQ